MFLKGFEASGSCQIDGSGHFQANLIQDSPQGKMFYQCADESLVSIIKQIYTLLMSNNLQATVCGKTVIKRRTAKGKYRAALDLGVMRIQIQTTNKPAVGWLLVRLPFETNDTQNNGQASNNQSTQYQDNNQDQVTEVLS